MRRSLVFLFVAAVALLLYAPTATFDFVKADDEDLIAGNRAFLSDLRNVPRAFTRSYFEVDGELTTQKTYYRPVTIVSFMLDTAGGGASPRPHHATNVVLHASATCLLLALALAWGAPSWAALAAALVFAVHPVNAQAVAWIAGRNDLLLAVFGLLSLLAWTSLTSRSARGTPGRAVAHVAAFGLALFSKETGIVVPLIAVLHRRLALRERLTRWHWIALGSDAALVVAWAVLRARALAGMTSELSWDSWSVVASNAPQVLVHLRKVFFPVPLNVSPGVQDLDLLLAALALVVLGFVTSRHLAGALGVLALVWVLLFLLPTLLVPGLPAYEHRAYVPLAGMLLCAAASLAERDRLRAPRAGGPPTRLAGADGPPRVAQVVGLAAILGVFATLTHERLDVFRDPFSYWTDGTRDPEFGPIAHVNLGQLHERAGRPADARREYLRALARDPNTPKAHNNLGVVLMALDEPDLAVTHFREEAARHPWNADAWFNLGLWHERHGQPAEATRYYERAIGANPSYRPAYEKLGRPQPQTP
ncbi:MAG: tetratricopeptide repeat protein [Vicinamibacterales bacterium]